MKMQVTIHEAKTNLSKLIRQVLAGEEVIIARNKTPLVKLVMLRRGWRHIIREYDGSAKNWPFSELPLTCYV